ncbi:unnamed protein product [Brassica rapa]|uniref:Uncharacterized protein n=1 Tax=Brassica campestris TaxID=3711 RepID=A0A8D9GSI8_BRACM|nr:unnamed protein product [Brassica rapa]
MSMEPSFLLLALYSGAELRRGGETSDGAAASNHLATHAIPHPVVLHPVAAETFPCCCRLCRVVNQGESEI